MPALTASLAVAQRMPYGRSSVAKAARALPSSPGAPDWLVVKAPSPLLGFNNNVRHKGRVFHIQTEDSGIRHPHIITHLFADGGRILKTTKTSYAEHVGPGHGRDRARR